MICMCKLFSQVKPIILLPLVLKLSLNEEGLWNTYVCLFAFTKTIYFVKYNLSNGFQIGKILLTMYENLKIFKLFLL